MAAYYWVGGSGTWDNSTTTNWALSSGGAGGAGVPTNADTVAFDSNSGTSATVTIDNTAVCLSATVNKSDITLSIAGNPTLGNASTFVVTNGTISLGMSASPTFSRDLTLSGAGAVLTMSTGAQITVSRNFLLSNATASATLGTATISGNFTFSAGTLTFNTGSVITVARQFTVSGTGSKSLTFGSNSYVKLTSTTGGDNLISIASGTTNLSISGTPGFVVSNTTSNNGQSIDCSAAYFTESTALNVYTTVSANIYIAGAITMPPGDSRVNFTVTGSFANFELTYGGVATSPSFASSSSLTVYGNLRITSTTTFPASVTFASTSSGKAIKTNGVSCTGAWAFNGVGGYWTLEDNLTQGSGGSAGVTITNGTFDASVHNVTLNGSPTSMSLGASGTLTMGSGTWTCTNNWTANSSATLNKGTANITFTGSNNTFAGGNKSYNSLTISGAGTGNTTVSGNNTFTQIADTRTSSHTIRFTAGTTQNIINFSVSGTPSITIGLFSTANGTPFTLSKSEGATVVQYANISDSTVTGNSTWVAYSSANLANNTGWTSITSNAIPGNYFAFFPL